MGGSGGEGDSARQPPRQLRSDLQCRGDEGWWYLPSPRPCGSQVGSLPLPRGFLPPGSRVPTLPAAARASTLGWCHRVPQQCHHPAPSPCAHQRRAPGGISRGRTRPAFLPLRWRLVDSSGRAQSKATDTADFVMPLLHTYLYSHRSVPSLLMSWVFHTRQKAAEH